MGRKCMFGVYIRDADRTLLCIIVELLGMCTRCTSFIYHLLDVPLNSLDVSVYLEFYLRTGQGRDKAGIPGMSLSA
jgi:hypothetical protein